MVIECYLFMFWSRKTKFIKFFKNKTKLTQKCVNNCNCCIKKLTNICFIKSYLLSLNCTYVFHIMYLYLPFFYIRNYFL